VLVVRDGDPQPQVSPSVVTIGAYDGVHIGHRAVIGQVRDEAARLGAHSVVVTFDRHPASVVRPETAPLLIADDEQKIELLGSTGVDATYVVTFGDEQSSESPERFVERVLVGRLGVRGVVVGEDFHFGHRRAGSVETLRAMGAEHGFEVIPVRLMARPDGVVEPVSSTAIRRALAGGQVESAATLLGRPFEVRGTVVHGDHRGAPSGSPPRTSTSRTASASPPTASTRGASTQVTVRGARAPSTSAAARPSWSAPRARRSRRTSSTSTATSTGAA